MNTWRFTLIFRLFLLIVSLSAFSLLACGGGGGDDDDSDADDDNDTGDDDVNDDVDDDVNDDVNDDINDDVDDDVNDDVDDDVNDDVDDDVNDDVDDDIDDDTVFDLPACDLPDPEGIAPNGERTIGGGTIDTQIRVYVFDDQSCDPIEGASVYHGDDHFFTDADGYVLLNAVDAAQEVTVTVPGCWAWSYIADARVMYFRLLCDDDVIFEDSQEGQLLMDDNPLALTNPDTVGELFSDPFYLGLVMKGLCRADLLRSSLFYDVLAEDHNWQLKVGANNLDLSDSIYLPPVNIELFPGTDLIGGNEDFRVLQQTGADDTPLQAFVTELALNQIFDVDTLIDFLGVIINGDPISDLVMNLIPDLIEGGVQFRYLGARPDWDGVSAPDIDMYDTQSQGSFEIGVTDVRANHDYIGFLMAEVPNRTLLPMSVGMVEEGDPASLTYANMPSTDYMAMMVATQMFSGTLERLVASIAWETADRMSDFGGSVSFDGSDELLPTFDDEECGYDPWLGDIEWQYTAWDHGRTDAFYVIYDGYSLGCPSLITLIPAGETSYHIPDDICPNFLRSPDDVAVVMGVDLPDGVDPNAFDVSSVFNYDTLALSLWSNVDIDRLLRFFGFGEE